MRWVEIGQETIQMYLNATDVGFRVAWIKTFGVVLEFQYEL